MKRKALTLAALVLFLTFALSACVPNKPPPPPPESMPETLVIPVAFYTCDTSTDRSETPTQGRERPNTLIYTADWDVKAGTLNLQAEPLLTVSDENYGNVLLSWEEDGSYVIADSGSITGKLASATFQTYSPLEGEQAYFGEGYAFTLSNADEPSCVLTADGTEIDLETLYNTIPMPDGSEVKFGDCTIIASQLVDTALTLYFRYVSPTDETACYLISLTLTPENGGITHFMSAPVPVPAEYAKGFTAYSDYGQALLMGEKLYFSGGDTIACYNTADGSFADFTTLTNQLDKEVMAKLQRMTREDGSKVPVQVMGSYGDVLLCHMSLESADPEKPSTHQFYFALREDSLLGLMRISESPEIIYCDLQSYALRLIGSYHFGSLPLREEPVKMHTVNAAG